MNKNNARANKNGPANAKECIQVIRKALKQWADGKVPM